MGNTSISLFLPKCIVMVTCEGMLFDSVYPYLYDFQTLCLHCFFSALAVCCSLASRSLSFLLSKRRHSQPKSMLINGETWYFGPVIDLHTCCESSIKHFPWVSNAQSFPKNKWTNMFAFQLWNLCGEHCCTLCSNHSSLILLLQKTHRQLTLYLY